MTPAIRPTESELQILKVLWAHGPCTVQFVHDLLLRDKSAGYTTTLKTMQIMYSKGLLSRKDDQRQHIYSAAVEESQVQKRLVGEFLDRVFSGSSSSLIMQALSTRKASPEELQRIRELLDEIDGEQVR